jgi:hypothetical protein
MTGPEFRDALTTLGWSQRYLTTLLACDTKLCTRWGRGTAAIPPPIRDWLTLLVASRERYPVPTDWRSFPRHETAHIDQDASQFAEQ